MESGGAVSFFQFDAVGNTAAILGANGIVLSSFSYAPFGEQLRAPGGTASAFQFGGGLGVIKTGSDLYFMRARSYDADLGRFVEADPLGTAGDFNLYRYAHNNPVNHSDPSGLADPATVSTIFGLYQTAVNLGLCAQANAICNGAFQAVDGGGEYLGAAEYNVPQLLNGLRSLVARGGSLGVSVGAGVASGGASAGATVGAGAAGATVAAPAATAAAPAATVAVPGATVAAPAAAGAGTAAEITIGTEVVEVAAAEGLGASGVAAAGGLLVAAGIGGAIVGTVIDEAVLDDDTKEIIGDTLVNIADSGGRLIDFIKNGFQHPSKNVASRDPNQKIGPVGFGSSSFVTLDQAFPYRIDFENDKDATAPAQRVTISDHLNSNLDLTTFELSDIGFGDTFITIPKGSQHFATTIEMMQNGKTFAVEIEVGLRSATGEVFATFQSLDPLTQLPPDVLTGFLPPEDGEGHGQEHVSYSIRPKANLTTGTEIRNVAIITFDSNPSIATDQVDPHDPSQGIDLAKQALNTIDVSSPTSTVVALPTSTLNTTFNVTWNGSDQGAGIAAYDLFVSDNDGPFTALLTNTTTTSMMFTGTRLHTYAFYTVARDNVGLAEAAPATADTTIEILPVPFVTAPGNRVVLTDTDGDIYTVKLTGPATAVLKYYTIDPDGAGPLNGPLDSLLVENATTTNKLTVTVKRKGDGPPARWRRHRDDRHGHGHGVARHI